MIASVDDRPRVKRMHSAAIDEEEAYRRGAVVHAIERHPAAALAVAAAIGLTIGWIVKRCLK